MRFRSIILGTLAVGACGASGDADKARLLEWRKLTIEQALRCDAPLMEMMSAMRDSDFVAGSAAATRTASVCREAATAVEDFGELPGEGTIEGAASCGRDSLATADAATRTIALIDGDVRPSVQAGIRSALDDRSRHMAACKADMAARARSLDVPERELEAIVEAARLSATGTTQQRTGAEILGEGSAQNR